jgi:hypothetical protein
MRCERLLGGVALAAMLSIGTAQGQAIPAGVHPVPAIVLQVLKAFDNPEGTIFSTDGKHVFVSNAAEIGDRGKDFGWTEGEGYVSKLDVNADGTLTMVKEQLITGLTGPLGMGVLPVATGKFPAGTIFLCTGSAPMVDKDGAVIKDTAKLQTKLLAFNEDGKVLGEIPTGHGSLFEKINGGPVALINALGFDKEGNVYFADTAFGAAQFDPPFEGKSGIWMIPHASLDALAGGEKPADAPKFIAVPGNPDGVEVSPKDGKIYTNTVGPVGGPDPAEGGVYAFTKADFTGDAAAGKLPPPVDSHLGALDGLDFTAGGVMLNTQIKGDRPNQLYVNCPGKTATTLVIEPGGSWADLTGPADIAIRRSADRPQLVTVPELFNRAPNTKTDQVTVLVLPAGFDAACGS